MGIALSDPLFGHFLWFADQAVDAMVDILEELGDARANRRPDLEGANSAYAIATHCLGVMEFWGGAVIAGRPVERDRKAEFSAAGPVAELVARMQAAKVQLASDIKGMDPAAEVRDMGRTRDVPYWQHQGGVLLHLLRELSQHLGHMELGRDVLRAESDSGAGAIDIACTLGAEAWVERIEEWRQFVRTSVVEREVSARSVRLVLGPAAGDEDVSAAVSLARREKECCTFFDFRLDLNATAGVTLVIGVPAEAEPVLASFAAMLDG